MTNDVMLTRAIPATGELLPVMGLGSWIQFDVAQTENERSSLTEVLTNMHRLGGRVINSSPMYGKAEKVIGDLTAATNFANDFFYATKVWTTGRQAGIDQMEASLQKMRRRALDLLQIHNLVDWQTHLQTLRAWKEEGKIRYIGITHYTTASHAQLQRILQQEDIDFVQFNYSIGVRNAEDSLLPVAMDRGVAVIVNEPLEKGSLFARVKGARLPGWAADYGMESWGQFFLKYIVAHPGVTCVIPGTSDPTNVVDNMRAGYGRLPDEPTRKKMIKVLQEL